VLSEFGGIALRDARGTWGYSCADGEEDLASRYERLLAAVRSIGMLSGFCYTQFADTYQEANGLLYADRRPKIPIARIAAATRGAAPPAISIGSTRQPDALPIEDVQALADGEGTR
jgi:hypothetical protein